MKLESIIFIDAPPDVVWGVTEAVEGWPEWTPTVESVRRIDRGPLDVGSTARLKLPKLPESTWTVTTLIRGARFSWAGRTQGIQMVATHEMEAVGTRTRSLIRIEMSGLVVSLLWPLMRRSARRQLEQENDGLKRWCESASGRS